MSKKGRMLVVVIGILVQMVLAVLYGFSKAPVSESMCFVIWCICAVMVYRLVEVPKTV